MAILPTDQAKHASPEPDYPPGIPPAFPTGSWSRLRLSAAQALAQGEQQRFCDHCQVVGPSGRRQYAEVLTASKPIEPGTPCPACVRHQGELRIPDPARQQMTLALLRAARQFANARASTEPLFYHIGAFKPGHAPTTAPARGPACPCRQRSERHATRYCSRSPRFSN